MTDGVYTFLTATNDGDVWVQQVHYDSGVATDTLLTDHGEATRATQPVPANVSANYVPNPALPTVIYLADGSINTIDADGLVYNPNTCSGGAPVNTPGGDGPGNDANGTPPCETQFVGAQVNSANYFFPAAAAAIGGIVRNNPGLFPAKPPKPARPGAAIPPRNTRPKIEIKVNAGGFPTGEASIRDGFTGAIITPGGVVDVDINPPKDPPGGKPNLPGQGFFPRTRQADGTIVSRSATGEVTVEYPQRGGMTVTWLTNGTVIERHKNGNQYIWTPRVPGPGYDVEIIVKDPDEFRPRR